MAFSIPNISSLLKEARDFYFSSFNSYPNIQVYAPGRVNLIGEHTDYNEGFVFPMALPLFTVIVGAKSENTNKCRLKSASAYIEDNYFEFLLPSNNNERLLPTKNSWANYALGVVENFHGSTVGFDAVVVSSVPVGGGLSSSAALEVAMYTFLEELNSTSAKSLTDKALACQKAEHDFAKVPCGIMDQFISTMAKEGSALLIDCRSLESRSVMLEDPSVTFVIINSNVKHSLSGSEYPSRRRDCHVAAEIMAKKSLREATVHDLKKYEGKMNSTVVMRVRHVISEIERTLSAVDALKKADYALFGKLMTKSHISLRDDYEVSCPELDELVNLALSVDGVFGSRMTGGGFGGCTVTLVKKTSVEKLIEKVHKNYSAKATVYVCEPTAGATVIKE